MSGAQTDARIWATGMQEALRANETFTSDDEAAAYWAEAAPRVPFEDRSYPGGAGQTQRARLYRGETGAPTLLYIHGGGWTGGSIELNEAATRGLVAESGWNVLSISYRLAPRHPYPAGLDDCRAALRWLKSERAALGLDNDRIALGGASAGANLALAMALDLDRDDVAGLLLYYGVFGKDFATPSYRRHEDGPVLTRTRMIEIFDLYDPDGLRDTDPRIAPLTATDLSHLPPACLIAAEHDVLLDDSLRMAERFAADGVPHSLHVQPGVSHGFINRGRLVPAARDCVRRGANFLKSLNKAS